MLNKINAAKQAVLIAAQEISRPTIAMALVAAQQHQVMFESFSKTTTANRGASS